MIRLWERPLIRALAFSAAVGIFLSIGGAFGSGDIAFGTRTAWFLAFSLSGGLVAVGVARLVRLLPWVRDRLWRRMAAMAVLMTLIMAPAVWLGVGAASGGLAVADLPKYLGFSLVTSVALTGLAYAVFRPTPITHAAKADAAPPKFLARLPVRLRNAGLWALEAEDHYLRVHTENGQDLILMRLGDAIAELDGIEGAQTHRSWWVARAAVKDVKRGDGRATLILPDDAEAPVSRTYLRTLREAGWF